MAKKVAIIGAGEFGKQAKHIMSLTKDLIPYCYFDDYHESSEAHKLPVLGKIKDVREYFEQGIFDELFIAIGYNHSSFKMELVEKFDTIPLATIVHPSSYIEESAILHPGVIIYGKCYIGPEVTLESGVTINVGCNIPHNNLIGKCSFISVGVNLGGNTSIGARNFIGVGTVFSDGISTVKDVTVGAGSTVIRDIEYSGTYVGSPAKKIK